MESEKWRASTVDIPKKVALDKKSNREVTKTLREGFDQLLSSMGFGPAPDEMEIDSAREGGTSVAAPSDDAQSTSPRLV